MLAVEFGIEQRILLIFTSSSLILGIKKCFNFVSYNEFTILFYSSIDISVYHLLAMYGYKTLTTAIPAEAWKRIYRYYYCRHLPEIIVWLFLLSLPFSVKSGRVKKKKTPPKGATHFKMAHFALQNKTIKDNMKRSNITDQVNVFFFPFERIIIIIVMLCRYRRTSQNP